MGRRPAWLGAVLAGALLAACSAGTGPHSQPLPSEAGPTWADAAPFGSTVVVGGWAVTVGPASVDRSINVVGADLVLPPGDSDRVVSAVLSARNVSDRLLDAADLALELVTPWGATHVGAACEGAATLGEAGTAQPGEAVTGRWCTVAPAEAGTGSVWAVADGIEEVTERRYVRTGTGAPGELPPPPVPDTASGRHLGAPAPAGTAVRLGDVVVAVGPTDFTPELVPEGEEDEEDPVPRPGATFVSTVVTLTNLGTDAVQPALGAVELVDRHGEAAGTGEDCEPLTRLIEPVGPVQPGGTATVTYCQEVWEDQVHGASWRLLEGTTGWSASYRFVDLGTEVPAHLVDAGPGPVEPLPAGTIREQPLPAGTAVEAGAATVELTAVETSTASRTVGYQDRPPGNGMVFLTAEVEVVEDTSRRIDSYDRYPFDVAFVDAAGVVHDYWTQCDRWGTGALGIDDVGTTVGGPRGEASGEICYEVPADAVDEGAWRVTGYDSGYDQPADVYVALREGTTTLPALTTPEGRSDVGLTEEEPAPPGTPLRMGLWIVELGATEQRDDAGPDEYPLEAGHTRAVAPLTIHNASSLTADPMWELLIEHVTPEGTRTDFTADVRRCGLPENRRLEYVELAPGGGVHLPACVDTTGADVADGHWRISTTVWSYDAEADDLVEETVVRYVSAG